MLNIAIYTNMPLSNKNHISVYGVSMFMHPLIKKLRAEGHEIKYCGKVAANTGQNIFCRCLDLKPYILDITKDVKITKEVRDCNALLVYNRPPFVKDEFNEQNYCIEQFISQKKDVLLWDGDLWSQHVPEGLREQSTLLRPYKSDKFDKLFKEAHEFHYFTHDLYEPLERREKIIDYLYLGNQYERFDEFKEVFEKLEGKIVIGGNWLKNEKKWNKSLQLKNVLYIGDVPHDMALSLYNISKNTFYIIPKHYQEVQMITSRIYEAEMTNCNTILSEEQKSWIDLDNLNTLDKTYNKFMEIIEK